MSRSPTPRAVSPLRLKLFPCDERQNEKLEKREKEKKESGFRDGSHGSLVIKGTGRVFFYLNLFFPFLYGHVEAKYPFLFLFLV